MKGLRFRIGGFRVQGLGFRVMWGGVGGGVRVITPCAYRVGWGGGVRVKHSQTFKHSKIQTFKHSKIQRFKD